MISNIKEKDKLIKMGSLFPAELILFENGTFNKNPFGITEFVVTSTQGWTRTQYNNSEISADRSYSSNPRGQSSGSISAELNAPIDFSKYKRISIDFRCYANTAADTSEFTFEATATANIKIGNSAIADWTSHRQGWIGNIFQTTFDGTKGQFTGKQKISMYASYSKQNDNNANAEALCHISKITLYKN